MNAADWIRDLPNHILEALRSLGWTRRGFSLQRLFLSLLLMLSGLATGLGLLALVKANTGEVGMVEGFVVIVLAIGAVVTMWIALEQAMVSMTWRARIACWLVYAFFLLWSIAFGFGFYWNRLASMEAAQMQIKGTVGSVANHLTAADGRLQSIRTAIQGVEDTALLRMKQERDGGGTCDTPSGAGGGNLCRARFAMTQAIDQQANDLVGWSGGIGAGKSRPNLNNVTCENRGAEAPHVDFGATPLQGEMQQLQQQGQSLARGSGIASPKQLAQQYLDYSTRAAGTLSRVDAILASAKDFASSGDQTSPLRTLEKSIREGYTANGETCRDPKLADTVGELASRLEKTKALGIQLPDLNVGEKATKAAFMRLYGNALGFFPWLFGFDNDHNKHPAEHDTSANPKSTQVDIETVEPLSNRDMIALIAAAAVDVAILFLSILSHNASPFQRMTSVFTLPMDAGELRRALLGVVREDRAFFTHFSQSLAIYRGHYFLVASPDVPELYGSVSAAIIMLHAAGLGQLRRHDDLALNRLSQTQRDTFSAALRAPLVASARMFDGASRSINEDDLLVIELPPRVIHAINLLLSVVPGDNAGAASADPTPDAAREPPEQEFHDHAEPRSEGPRAHGFAAEDDDFEPGPSPHPGATADEDGTAEAPRNDPVAGEGERPQPNPTVGE